MIWSAVTSSGRREMARTARSFVVTLALRVPSENQYIAVRPCPQSRNGRGLRAGQPRQYGYPLDARRGKSFQTAPTTNFVPMATMKICMIRPTASVTIGPMTR